ncbi:DoxX family protein [Streptomyces aidingensis]|uniref:Uncharacterized membrane protein YphA, DoxX/SURF4 family n=1 Tax=Streptomyces aidingensis TaxID=910347 RepID=A0A1I1R0Y9_9ACTN|nr:DoxX family protein [Streptomyces aidingensis]SFD27897.1 Uncharacterized membrane protein YphA, DoxX/SURF4 family [Streptomyces aidingensis]
MDVLVLIGRILFVMVFLGSGLNHLTQTRAMSGYAASKGVPLPTQATVVTGVMQLVGGLMVLLGIWADLGALLLAAFVIPTPLIMHRFWSETDPAARQNEMIHFMKDLGLGGAALMLLAFFSYAGDDLGLTLTGPLFGIG